MFASNWFITAFSADLPLNMVFRIFDLLFVEGPDILFKISLALLNRSEPELIKQNFDQTIETLMHKLYLKFSNPGFLSFFLSSFPSFHPFFFNFFFFFFFFFF